MDPFDNTEPIKFTALLRDKLRQGACKTVSDSAEQLKLITKSNLDVKRSFQLSKEGIVVDPCYFEPEATLLRRARLSEEATLRRLFEQFEKVCHRLKSKRMKPEANLARHWKYINNELRINKLPTALDKDFYEWKQDFDKKGTAFTDEAFDFVKLNLN